MEPILNILGLFSIITICTLVIMLVSKMDMVKRLRETVGNLNRSLDEMDEQAKLIVRTDMELNKTQEELDKKVGGLYALQKISSKIGTTLEENQVFNMLEPRYLSELGFEKMYAMLWREEEEKFTPALNLGYLEDEMAAILSSIESHKERFLELIRGEKTISTNSTSVDTTFKENAKRVFKASSFIISPILPKEGDKGFLFLGTQNADTVINEGDEELIIILANQLGQSLENARLFEKTWRAQQDLEKKVEERTRELTKALNDVKAASRRKTDFVSSVSHELRTPLTSIKGYASILLAGKLGEVPKEIRERLEKINRHSDELVALVNDLLDIARIESGKIMMKVEKTELKDIVEKIGDMLAVQLKERRIDFAYDIAAEASSIMADPRQIERVFINLVGNALKFTPANGKISVRAYKAGGAVQVDITDTGCGIPEEAQESIFEEFYRVDNTINLEVKGTGLGLALVKNIVEAHNGKIWVKSKIGLGSTFSLTLPQPT